MTRLIAPLPPSGAATSLSELTGQTQSVERPNDRTDGPRTASSRLRQVARAWPYAVPAVLLAIVYGATLQRSTGNGFSADTTKFDYLGKILGTAHPPGYPLYTMFDALIVRVVPFGSVAGRVNLLSALCAIALCVVVVDILLSLRVRPVLAAGGATAIGLIPEMWQFAVVAEVYTMTMVFIGLILACVLRFDTTGRRWWLRAAVLVLALSFAHATSTVLLIPGLLLYVAVRRIGWLFRPHELAALLPISAALALLPYLYLFWRTEAHAAFLDTRVSDVGSFVAVITGARYGPEMFAVPSSQLSGRIVELGQACWTQFGPFLVLCLVGLGALPLRRRRLVAAVLMVWALCNAAFFAWYKVDDWTTMLLPLWLVVGLWGVVGLDAVVNLASWPLRRAGPAQRRAAQVRSTLIALLSAVVVISTAVAAGYSVTDRSKSRPQIPIDAAVARVPDNSVIFVSNWGLRHQFNYRLLPGELGARRDVWAAKGIGSNWHRKTTQIRAYCIRGSGLWAWAKQELAQAPGVPRGLHTYIYGSYYAGGVKAQGLKIHHVSGPLYEVRCPGR